jgi:alanine-synthesizing transaminase
LYKYSHRLSWSIASNIFSQLVEQKREAGAKLLDLTVSNPTEAFEDYPHSSIARAYRALPDFAYRPDPFGEESARLAIAEYYASRDIFVSPRQLLLTASTSEAYGFLFKLLCDPGDEILVPVPSYPLFEYLASLESVHVVPYRLRYDGSWFIDLAGLSQRLSPRTRAIIVVNPNNPTGSFLKSDEVQQLFRLAGEHGLPVISDEVFMDYSIGAHPGRIQTLLGSNSALTFSLNGLSKCAGMPQMKLAWIVISGPEQDCDLACKRLELISDTYLSVSTPVQRALPELLRVGAQIQQQIAARIQHNLGVLTAMLENTSAHVLHCEGGWSAIIQLPAVSSEETWVARLLSEHDIVVQPGYFFDLESGAHVVVSLITRPEAFAEAIQKLKQTVDQ